MMKRVLLAAVSAFVLLYLVTWSGGWRAQERFGINMFVQEAEPVDALNMGSLWYRPTTGETRLLLSMAPSVWRFSDGGIGRGVPALSSCGTTPSLASGSTDSAGVINVGSGLVTACTLTFGTAPSAAPTCQTSVSATTVVPGVTTSVTQLVMALSLTLGGGKIHYACRAL